MPLKANKNKNYFINKQLIGKQSPFFNHFWPFCNTKVYEKTRINSNCWTFSSFKLYFDSKMHPLACCPLWRGLEVQCRIISYVKYVLTLPLTPFEILLETTSFLVINCGLLVIIRNTFEVLYTKNIVKIFATIFHVSSSQLWYLKT